MLVRMTFYIGQIGVSKKIVDIISALGRKRKVRLFVSKASLVSIEKSKTARGLGGRGKEKDRSMFKPYRSVTRRARRIPW